MSLGGLVRSFSGLTNSVSNFGQIFTTGSLGLPYPSMEGAVNEIRRSLWASNEGYSFSVIKRGSAVFDISNLFDFKGGNFQEFNLPINPSDIQQDEPFAITVRPTQSGNIVEHEGFVSKSINISGTTGLYPHRGYGGVLRSGSAIFSVSRSGYESFQLLRNYIRAYAEFKANPENKDYFLIFNNYKDNEFWAVEPESFTMKRDPATKTIYRYSISLRVVGDAKTVLAQTEDLITQIINTIDQVTQTVSDLIVGGREIVLRGFDFINRVEQTAETTFLYPLEEVKITIDAIKNGSVRTAQLPRRFYQNVLTKTRMLEDKVADVLGIGSGEYNRLYGRTATVLPVGEVMTDDHVRVLQGLSMIRVGLQRLLASNLPFDDSISGTSLSTPAEQELRDGRLINLGNVESLFKNQISIPIPNSMREMIVEQGDTLERIAMRTLGNAMRWIELKVLNSLEYPYIDPDSASEKVLRPGDKILIPSTEPSNLDNAVVNSRETKVTRGMTPSEKSYGVDLQLSSTNDLILDNRGDFELIAGRLNGLQAIMIRLGLEKGSLQSHPQIGVNLNVGTKINRIARFLKEEIERNIISDSRFKEVEQLDLDIQDSTVILNLVVVGRGSNQRVPLRLTF